MKNTELVGMGELIRDVLGVEGTKRISLSNKDKAVKTGAAKVVPGRKAASGAKRDRAAEALRAKNNQIERVVDLTVARHNQSLGDEYIKLAQALILCTLPHSPTKETKVTRRARLGDGSVLSVTFSAAADGVSLPYGADRRLLFWLLDRAIRNDSAFVPWSSAAEYQIEMGMKRGGRQNQQLRDRFLRLSGLVINIQRKGSGATGLQSFAVIDRAYLPNSIISAPDENTQASLPELGNRFGIQLNAPLFADIKRHNAVMPRRLWQEIDGPTAVQDLVFWLYIRCYAAASETIIPWSALTEQFPQEDSNPWRMKQHVRKALSILTKLWPQAQVKEVKNGIWVDKAKGPMLDDDPSKNRTRLL